MTSQYEHSSNNHDQTTNMEYSQERNNNNNKNLTLEYGKTIKLLRNGDEFYSGQKIVINSRKYRYFDVFLDDLSNTLNARFGAVRNIHTPLHGHKIKSLDQIQDGKTYVAAGVGKFKRLNYLEIAEGRKPLPQRLPAINRRPFFSNDVQTKSLFEKTNNILIFVYRNGDVLTPPVKVLLYKHTLISFEAVLNEITQKVQLQNGAVLKLYTLEGSPVYETQQLVSGNSYVATNKERFKRCEYFSPEDFGISPRPTRKANSQPSSVPGSIASTSGKTTYSGKPYSGWHPSRDELFSTKSNQRRNIMVKPIDVDKDDGKIYKARHTSNREIKEIPDSDDMKIDLPISKIRAEEIEIEDMRDDVNQTNFKSELNNNKSEFQEYLKSNQYQENHSREFQTETNKKPNNNQSTKKNTETENIYENQADNIKSDFKNRYKRELNENEAASIIQASYRGYKTRETYSSDTKNTKNYHNKTVEKEFNIINDNKKMYQWYLNSMIEENIEEN